MGAKCAMIMHLTYNCQKLLELIEQREKSSDKLRHKMTSIDKFIRKTSLGNTIGLFFLCDMWKKDVDLKQLEEGGEDIYT